MRQISGEGHLPFADVTVGRDDATMCFLAKLFNGLSDSTRLSILLILAKEGETRVGELVQRLEATQPRISDHLRTLTWCGYIKVRREGRGAYYSLADERVMEMGDLGLSLLADNR